MAARRQLIFTILALASIALAHEQPTPASLDVTPSDTNPNTTAASVETDMSAMMMMTPYFHWMADADALYFKSWVPRTVGALVGACFALFFLAIFERFLGSAKGLLEAWWRRRHASEITRALVTPDNASVHSYSKSIESGSAYLTGGTPPLIAPFEPWQDTTRGAMQAVQSLIGFFLMLSVMTYNGAFLIAVILGLGVGEIAFARFGRSGAHPGCVAARTHG